MKLYHAALFPKVFRKLVRLFQDIKLNILLSYANIGYDVEYYCLNQRNSVGGIILDSGTWSANNSKTIFPGSVTLSGFMDYLLTINDLYDSPLFDEYFNFDIDHSDKGFGINYENYLDMTTAGLSPTYVIHDIYSSEVDYFIDKGCKRLALGSGQIKTSESLDRVMEKTIPAGVSVHLFGHTKFNLIADFPIDSCDSAGWAYAGKYGYIRWFNPKKEGRNKTDKIYLEEYTDTGLKHNITLSAYEYREDLEDYLYKTFGMSSWDLLSEREGTYNKMLVNTYYYSQLEKVVNQIHREQGFKTDGVEVI